MGLPAAPGRQWHVCGCSPSFDRRGVTVAGTVPVFHWIPFSRRGPDGLRCVTENGGKNRIRKQSRKGIRDASQVCRGHQGCQPSLPGASGMPAKFAGGVCGRRRIWPGTCRGVLHTPHHTALRSRTGTKKGIPICLGMPFNHSGVSVGRMQFAPTTGYPIPPAT